MNEFDLIHRYFHFSQRQLSSPDLGVGDDCALLTLAAHQQLAVSTDTLVAGTHFPATAKPYLIARRALRVNLSDLAAMGATPLGFQLALTLPSLSQQWLADFSRGLAEDAHRFACPLVGGDTTKGPLSISLTVMGAVPKGEGLLRSGATIGDKVFVTGCLGGGAAGLQAVLQAERGADQQTASDRQPLSPLELSPLEKAYWLPEPQLQAGTLLRQQANAALDISDGFLQDLGHIAKASGVSAHIFTEQLPLIDSSISAYSREQLRDWALTGGDDYQLCFTLPQDQIADSQQQLAKAGIHISEVGHIVAQANTLVDCFDAKGTLITPSSGGYDHFSNNP